LAGWSLLPFINTQIIWEAIKRREMVLSTIDIVSSTLGNISVFLSIFFQWKYPVLAITSNISIYHHSSKTNIEIQVTSHYTIITPTILTNEITSLNPLLTSNPVSPISISSVSISQLCFAPKDYLQSENTIIPNLP